MRSIPPIASRPTWNPQSGTIRHRPKPIAPTDTPIEDPVQAVLSQDQFQSSGARRRKGKGGGRRAQMRRHQLEQLRQQAQAETTAPSPAGARLKAYAQAQLEQQESPLQHWLSKVQQQVGQFQQGKVSRTEQAPPLVLASSTAVPTRPSNPRHDHLLLSANARSASRSPSQQPSSELSSGLTDGDAS